ncbi:MAG: hypothetical protein JRG96_09900 [Deltaproteobacteria bacterium]|nr:hypothetical protein [Deltaproteobacteria bacterium]MBW2418918.1 hypothetical protein [Deltaproteobacteria bacterium]
MAQRATFIDEGLDKVQTMFRSVEDEFQKLQKQTQKRRKELEKQTQKRRKDFEKRTKRFEKDLRNNTVVKKAESIRVDVSKQLDDALDQMLGWLPFATQSDLSKIDRKLNQINRKLRTLEGTGSAKPKASTRRSSTH